MKTRLLVLAGGLILGGAAMASEAYVERGPPTPPPESSPRPAVAPGAIAVVLSSVTLGEECGESPVPAPSEKASIAAGARAYNSCNQTSMQLTVLSGKDAAGAAIAVKKVEIFDKKGKKLISTLAARGPSAWSAENGAYQPWDEKSVPGQDLPIRYVLTTPDWSKVRNAYNKSYTVKVIVTVGGKDQPLTREVYLQGEVSLPPGVVT